MKKSTARKGGARKSASRGAAKRSTARSAAKRGSARRSRPAARKQSPVARVRRVTREVVQQATSAVSTGMETLKDFGENLVERVRQD